VHALVIDDSKSIRSILAKILLGVGFTVEEAANGLEALDLIKKEKVDLATCGLEHAGHGWPRVYPGSS